MNKDACERVREHRETLEALADRDDLRVSEIAKALLKIADEPDT